MNLTFILGNGFDLKLGMKTRYVDMYESYVKTESKTETIKKFKEDLARKEKYENWSDFEMGMAEYAKTLSSEGELIECVRDFRLHMIDYLNSENERIKHVIANTQNASSVISEIDHSFRRFFDGLIPNAVNAIQRVMNKDAVRINCLVFNYTQSLEALNALEYRVRKTVKNKPLHIHGVLGEDVVLGLDSIDQFEGLSYNITRKGKRAFIKPIYNEQFDEQRVELAVDLINASDIICVYGFSFGKTDETWVQLISAWLRESSVNQLVVFQYDETQYNRNNRDELMDVEDEKRDKLLDRLGFSKDEQEGMENQVHIPIGVDIFNFGFTEEVHKKPAEQLSLA